MTRTELPDLVERWARGWAASRALARDPDVATCRLLVRDTYRETEVVLARPTPGQLGDALTAVAGDPRAWVTVVGRAEIPRRPGVEVRARDEVLMGVALAAPVAAEPPAALVVRREAAAGRVLLELRDGDVVAAAGQVGLAGQDAVFDKIQTATTHRRRGLASWLVRALTGEALAAGATTGLLIASPMGQPLYAGLGWRVLAPVTSLQGAGRQGAAPR